MLPGGILRARIAHEYATTGFWNSIMIGQLSPSDPRMHNAPSKARRSMVLLPDAVCSSGNSGRSDSLWAHQTLTANQSLRSGDRPIRKTVPSPSRCNHDGAVGDLSARGTPGRGWPASPVGALRRWHGRALSPQAGRDDTDTTIGPVPASRRDPRVDAYIDALPEWQRDVARSVRRLVHEADPEVEEVIKRSRQPYFVLQGNICALLGARNHLNVFIYDPIAPDPHGLINQGRDNATARGIQIRRDDEFDEAALLDLFRAVVANNRAGGWRKIQSSG